MAGVHSRLDDVMSDDFETRMEDACPLDDHSPEDQELVRWFEAGNGYCFTVGESFAANMWNSLKETATDEWLFVVLAVPVGEPWAANVYIRDPIDAARFRAKWGA